MRHLISLGLALAATAGCGGDTGTGQDTSGVHSAGGANATGATSGAGGARSSGGASNGGVQGLGGTSGAPGSGGVTAGSGGVSGEQCQADMDCPQLGCQGCPASVCANGKCVAGPTGSGGASSGLKWFTTCGPPVCQAPTPDAGGSSSGIPRCTNAEAAGIECTTADAECDPGTACSGPLRCATSDPTNGGQCPKSRAKYKQDIEYLTPAERSKLAADVQSIPLVRYRYKDGPEREHLGFIIEDVEPSPSVDSQHDQVDLYGYTSMAIAGLQEQRREIDGLKAEIRELRGELAKKKGVGAK